MIVFGRGRQGPLLPEDEGGWPTRTEGKGYEGGDHCRCVFTGIHHRRDNGRNDRWEVVRPCLSRRYDHFITDRGKAVLEWQFRDGSSHLDKLREAAGSIYERVGSRYGSKFRIVPNTGNLHVRKATRAEQPQLKIYTALDLHPAPGGVTKLIV